MGANVISDSSPTADADSVLETAPARGESGMCAIWRDSISGSARSPNRLLTQIVPRPRSSKPLRFTGTGTTSVAMEKKSVLTVI